MIEIIKLDATNSTNDYLKEKLSTINKKKTIIAYTYNQKKAEVKEIRSGSLSRLKTYHYLC